MAFEKKLLAVLKKKGIDCNLDHLDKVVGFLSLL